MLRIPITMCHGTRNDGKNPLPAEHLSRLVGIAAELGFESINYDQLDAWRHGGATLPPKPIMFDFEHPVKSMFHEVHPILARHGCRGNLFINTGPMAHEHPDHQSMMTWDEVRELVSLGWHIGAHTVTHPNLSKLVASDPSGEQLRSELERCDATLKEHLNITPRDFAYTGTSFSTVAEREVKRRYRFGRLWITQALYDADGQKVRYADLVGVPGQDEPDGGPPMAARYITKDTPAHRLPSMEFQALIHTPEAFRRYLEGALCTLSPASLRAPGERAG